MTSHGSMQRAAIGQGLLPHDVRTADIETSSDDYAGRFSGAVGRWFLDVQARAALGLLENASASNLTVLDVGGGHGQLTNPFLAAGHRVVTHGSRSVCHRRLDGLGPRIGRVVSDLWHLPFPDGSFDLVIGIRLLAHVEAWQSLLGEMVRVSRDLVMVDFPARGPHHALVSALFGAKRKLEGNTRPYFEYTTADVERAFAAHDLRVAGAIRQFALPMALHRSLRSASLSASLESAARALRITEYVGSPVMLLATRAAVPSLEPAERVALAAGNVIST